MTKGFDISKRNLRFGNKLILFEKRLEAIETYLIKGWIDIHSAPDILGAYNQILKFMDSYCPRVVSGVEKYREIVVYRLKNELPTKAVTVLSPIKIILREMDKAIWDNHLCKRCILNEEEKKELGKTR